MLMISRDLVSRLLLVAVLASCSAMPKPPGARYDFGPLTTLATTAATLPVATVEVTAAPWLAGIDMHYRLLYAEPQRRFAYGQTQWAATPAELLGNVLRRQASGAGHCRLRVMLDELEQRFDSPETSHVQVELRVKLLPARGDVALAQHTLALREAVAADAGNPGARAGAAATARAVERMSKDVSDWLRSVPAATLQRC